MSGIVPLELRQTVQTLVVRCILIVMEMQPFLKTIMLTPEGIAIVKRLETTIALNSRIDPEWLTEVAVLRKRERQRVKMYNAVRNVRQHNVDKLPHRARLAQQRRLLAPVPTTTDQ